MKQFSKILFLAFVFVATAHQAIAQCSICTKTAQQLGEGPAAGLNNGIIYLGFVPLAIIGYIGFRWWKNEKLRESEQDA